MKYRVRHTTAYHYGERIPLCHNVIRLHPRDTAAQTCEHHVMSILPMPAARRDWVDFFGNNATWFSVQEPHSVLKIETFSLVDVHAQPMADRASAPWEEAARLLAQSDDRAMREARPYCFDSMYIQAEPELVTYAQPTFATGRPLLECLIELNTRIYKEFIFDSRASTIGSPVLEVLHNRRGVCQDFAHLMIGCLRSLGLAGRYVSGYVLTHPPAGQKRMVGCDASHAWVSAFIPTLGWVDFDPTNGALPTNEHVTIGWARDYDDVSPIKGVLVGGHRHSMTYGVDVQPLEADGSTKPGDGRSNPAEPVEKAERIHTETQQERA